MRKNQKNLLAAPLQALHPAVFPALQESLESCVRLPLPELWANSARQAGFWERLRQSRFWLLLLDYDGTLAPFHQDRMKAVPYAGVIEQIEALRALPGGRIVLVSGRQIAELRELFPLNPPLEMWGSHGREHLLPDGRYRLLDLNDAERRVVDGLVQAMQAHGWEQQLELKPTAVAVHWRGLPEPQQQAIREAAEQYFAEASEQLVMLDSLEMMPFESGLELRSRSRTKGQVIAELVAEEAQKHEGALAVTAFLGDDWTDEDGFAALPAEGLGVLVKDEPRPSRASVYLRPPEDLLAFLTAWGENSPGRAI